MKGSRFPRMARRISSTPHYQTFPVKPPSNRGRPLQTPAAYPTEAGGDYFGSSGGAGGRHGSAAVGVARRLLFSSDGGDGGNGNGGIAGNTSMSSPAEESSLPWGQLTVLAIISLAEQTALNSISPYLPEMASSFPEVDVKNVGLYVGLIASSFALTQFITGYMWGWLSDKIGRKPVVLTGTFLTAGCFLAFGFCRTLWQAMIVQALMGLVNGNTGVVSSCLGEITDRTNQSKAFAYLPVLYGLGSITGPALGGLLVGKRPVRRDSPQKGYPFLLPNVVSAVILMIDLVITMLFLEESLEEAKELPPLGARVRALSSWLWQRIRRKGVMPQKPSWFDGTNHEVHTHHRTGSGETGSLSDDSQPTLLPDFADGTPAHNFYGRDTILILASYLIFQLANVSFNSLYPIFASAPEPVGRDLAARFIGLSLAFAGIVAIVFQVAIFGSLRDRVGNKVTYQASLAGFVIAFMIMPWVGYKNDGENIGWLWAEIGFALLIKTIASVGGLTCALLMITNSAPNHNVLGTLNGLAQTLSAGGRAIGPLLSGGLFSASTHVHPKGEALAWGVFGGVSFVGFLLSFGIKGHDLESEKEYANAEEGDYHQYSTTEPRRSVDESDPLLARRSDVS